MMYRHKGTNYTCDYTYTYTLYLLLFLLHSAYRISCRPNFDGFSRTMLEAEQACSLYSRPDCTMKNQTMRQTQCFSHVTANRRNMILKIAHNDSYHWTRSLAVWSPPVRAVIPALRFVMLLCLQRFPRKYCDINSLYRHTT